MPRYNVVAKVVGSKYLGEFEAETAEEAIEKALVSRAAHISLCHQCTDECEDPECEEATAEMIDG